MAKGPALALVLSTLSLSAHAGAEEAARAAAPSPTAAAPSPTAAAVGSPSAPTPVRRDPKGKKGVTAFAEALALGDRLAIARDYARAKEAYQAALAGEPKQAIGHYRMSQLALLEGKLEEAETACTDALRFADRDPPLRAKLLFVLAEIRERTGQRDAAIKAWQDYADYRAREREVAGYAETAEVRQKVLIRYNMLVAEANGTKARTEQRVKEVDDARKRTVKVNER